MYLVVFYLNNRNRNINIIQTFLKTIICELEFSVQVNGMNVDDA